MKKVNKTIMLCAVFLCFSFLMSYGQGARYTGEYTKTSAIQHTNKSNIVIEGLEFSNITGDIISLYNCENVIIRNNRFSSSSKRGVYMFNCKNVTIVDNTFENVHTAMTASTSQGVKFDYNDVKNIGGLLALSDDSNNGFVALFIQVSGAGNSISYNVAENIYGDSSPGDLINVNQSHGTAQSPIIVKGNWFRGGGPSPSGGGILLGDLGGSYQIAEDNILVNPGQYGMGIGGGNNITLRNNKVFGKRESFTNAGYTICNWSEQSSGPSHDITFEKNIVNYTNRDGVKGESWWIYKNMEPVKGKETNLYDPNLTASILPDQIFGRARSSNPGEQNPGDGSTTDPKEELPTEPEVPEIPVQPENPGIVLPDIVNHPSIQIYLDSYNRACVNNSGYLSPSAKIIAANNAGEIIYEQRLTRFHTVLPNRPEPGTYHIFVSNGDRQHLKSLYIK